MRLVSPLPVLVVELKWNKSAGGAIAQIKDRHYPEILKDDDKDIILVGINYDSRSKRHECRIERLDNLHSPY